MKIFNIVGARPQFIKAAVISRAMEKLDLGSGQGHVSEVLVHTGQHYQDNMSRIFFEELELPAPRYDLGIHHRHHGAMTGRMMEALEDLMLCERPEAVIVYGDTNSTLAGALSASKLGIPVAHVEAGMRSFKRSMPEEINRVITDHISTFLFCPTKTALENLEREGIAGDGRANIVSMTGDVMLDAFLYYKDRAVATSRIIEKIPAIKDGKRYILATVHRAENTDDPARLSAIIESLNALAEELPVVWPLHPRTKTALRKAGMQADTKVILLDPLGYLDMIALECLASLVVTDSGGVQREACFARVPCVILREETEWPELIEAGCALLSGVDRERILSTAFHLLYQEPAGPDWHVLGDGRAGYRIVDTLGSCLFG